MRLLTALLASTFALPATAGEVQLLPAAGEFIARDGRPGKGKSFKLTDAIGQRIAASMSATAAKTPIVVDYDHQTLYVNKHGQKAPAAGWALSAEWRTGQGLFAKVDWTDAAKAHIGAREYQYVSPVLLYDADTGQVEGVALAALVNYPALLGMHAAVAALATQFDPTHSTETTDMTILAALIGLLGLPAATTEAAALDAVKALHKPAPLTAALATALDLQGTPDEAAALSAIAALKTAKAPAADAGTLAAMTALQGQVALLTSQINDDKLMKVIAAAEAEGKIVPATRQVAIDLGKKDMAALSAFIAAMPAVPLGGQSGGKGAAAAADAAGSRTEAAALATDLQRAFGLSAEQFAKGAPAGAAH